jgi:hypothetical protein
MGVSTWDSACWIIRSNTVGIPSVRTLPPASGSPPSARGSVHSFRSATAPGPAASPSRSDASGHRRSCRPRLPAPLFRDHPLVRRRQVLASQHLLHQSRSPLPGFLSRRRNRLTRSTGILGGSAAYLPGPLQPLSLLSASLRSIEPFVPVRLLMFGPSPPCAMRLLWPRLTSRSAQHAMSKRSARASPFQAQGEISQGKARDLRSIHPPHLRPSGLECLRASGLLPPRPSAAASYAVRVPRAGALPPASFPRPLTKQRLPFS